LAYLSIIGFCVFVARKSATSIYAIPYLVSVAIQLALFFGGLFGSLSIVSGALLAIGIVLIGHELIASEIRLIKHHLRLKNLKALTQSRSGRVSLLLVIVFCWVRFVTPNDYRFARWDEFSFWGASIKELHERNSLWDSNSPILFKHYVPGQQLFQYFFLRHEVFSERAVFAAHLTLICFAIFAIAGFLVDGFGKKIPFLFLSALIPSMFHFSFDTIEADLLLGLQFAVAFAIASKATMSDSQIPLVLSLAGLVIQKEAGLIFAIVILLFGVSRYVTYAQQLRIPLARLVLRTAFAVLALSAPVLTWKVYLYHMGIRSDSAGGGSRKSVRNGF